MIFSSFTLTGKLNGSTSVEFTAGVASFTDLSIDHEDKNYVLNIEAFTIPPSRYQYSQNTDPFDVKERVLALLITQQPGKLAARVASVSSLSVKATTHRKHKEETPPQTELNCCLNSSLTAFLSITFCRLSYTQVTETSSVFKNS